MGLALFALAALAQPRDPLPVPNVAPYRTLKCDFHLHTVFSDGEVWPTTRVTEAWRDGLDAIAITDHAGYNPNRLELPANLTRPHAIAQALADQTGALLIPAVEIAEGNLHANALFVKDPNVFFGLGLLAALRKAREQGAIAFWNHPGWKGTAEWFEPIAQAHGEGLLQGIELVNGLDFYREAYPWVEAKKLAIFANSDLHSAAPAQYAPRKRPITLVFAARADLDGVREALEARRTAAWMGGEVWGEESLLKGLWEGAAKALEAGISVDGVRRTTGLKFHNQSAIPFKVRASKAPPWLGVRDAELPEGKVAAIIMNVARSAPVGRNQVEIELEITNLHTGPGRNLTVTVPLIVTVAK
jgi:hypothetical protein